jgi:hypothetical protein
VFDLDAREVIRDRLAMGIGGTLALMRLDLRGALAMRFIRRLDRRQHLRLVEQHSLVGVLFGGIGALRGAPVVLGLEPPNFLLQQHFAFDGLLMFALELLVREFDLLESLVLFAQQPNLLFGDFQTDGKLGVFIRQCDRIFVRREHTQIVLRRTNNSTKICSTHVRKADHPMRCRPHIVAIEQPVQLLRRQRD